MSMTRFMREENRKVTLRLGENDTEIDFVLIRKCGFSGKMESGTRT